ncbi:MAG: helix-turn-helix domain-containing protein [Anaerovoracaceae bacterium]
MSDFSSRLKELRIIRNIKQKELAELLNVAQTTITNWETGTREPNISTIKKIADVLEVDISELFYEERPAKNKIVEDIEKTLFKLNEQGKKVAADRVRELSEISRFKITK